MIVHWIITIFSFVFYFYYAIKYWWLKSSKVNNSKEKLNKYRAFYIGSIVLLLLGNLIWAIIRKYFL